MSTDIYKMTMHEISEALTSGTTTSREVCRTYLDRADSVEPKVKAFLYYNAEDVLSQADASDKRRSEGKELGPFDGVPVSIKDNMAVKGQPCRCASKILEPVNAPYDATVISRLRGQGMVLFGRVNMDEFAMGSSCENSAFENTANPWDIARVPGGSSGGSAASVAAREVPVSLGSDTGGSIRQPASFCGVVGLKPTYGRVSRYGLTAFASSLDQIGPLSQDVPDSATVLDIISGHDLMDSTSLPGKDSDFAASLKGLEDADLGGVKIGLPKEYTEIEGVDEGVKNAFEKSIKVFSDLGAEIVEVSLPNTKYAIATYYIIATAEASANLARFDGIRYGARTPNAKDLMETYFKSRGEGFGDEVKRRIILGTYVLSSGYYDAYYLRAQKVRTLIRNDFEKALESCNVILTPVSPVPAFKFGEKSDPLQMYLADIFTISLNLAGNCGISVPAEIDDATGMPVGIQLIAPPMGEKELLKVARIFELNRSQRYFVPAL